MEEREESGERYREKDRERERMEKGMGEGREGELKENWGIDRRTQYVTILCVAFRSKS